MTMNLTRLSKSVEYDAIVVGSGISGGGWAAKELSEKGLKTLVLERGRSIVHGKDYITERRPSWGFAHLGLVSHELLERDYFIQKRPSCFFTPP